MKKNLWLLVAVLCMAVCSQNEEIIAEQPTTEDDFKSPDGRVVIRLGGSELNTSASTTVTRAPITDTNFVGTNIGVFTLAVNSGTDITAANWSTAVGVLLNNIQGVITTQANSPGSEAGAKKISLYRGGTSGAVYYYPIGNRCSYTFYGYSPYRATGTTITTSQATAGFTFNGSQGIMRDKAAAPNIPKQSTFIDGSTDEKSSSVLTGYKAKYIRQLKYHHGLITTGGENGDDYKWVPNINFTRLLTQFTFRVMVVRKWSEADEEAAQKLKVKSVRIRDHGTSAILDMMDGTLTWIGNESLFMLPTGTDNVTIDTFTPSTARNGDDRIGYLMARPTDGAAALELEATIEAPNAVTSVSTKQTVILQVNAPSGFKQGIIYNVRIGVYSMQEAMVDATLIEW